MVVWKTTSLHELGGVFHFHHHVMCVVGPFSTSSVLCLSFGLRLSTPHTAVGSLGLFRWGGLFGGRLRRPYYINGMGGLLAHPFRYL